MHEYFPLCVLSFKWLFCVGATTFTFNKALTRLRRVELLFVFQNRDKQALTALITLGNDPLLGEIKRNVC